MKKLTIGIIIFCIILIGVIILIFSKKSSIDPDDPCATIKCGKYTTGDGKAKPVGNYCVCPCELDCGYGTQKWDCSGCDCGEALCQECDEDGNSCNETGKKCQKCPGVNIQLDDRCKCVTDKSYCDENNTDNIKTISYPTKQICTCKAESITKCEEVGAINERCICQELPCQDKNPPCKNNNEICASPKGGPTPYPSCYEKCDVNYNCAQNHVCVKAMSSTEEDVNICVPNTCYDGQNQSGYFDCKNQVNNSDYSKCKDGKCYKPCDGDDDCEVGNCSSEGLCIALDCYSDPLVSIYDQDSKKVTFPMKTIGSCDKTCRLVDTNFQSCSPENTILDNAGCESTDSGTGCGCDKDIIDCNNIVDTDKYVIDLRQTFERAQANTEIPNCKNLKIGDIQQTLFSPDIVNGGKNFPDSLSKQSGIAYMVLNSETNKPIKKTDQSLLKDWQIWNGDDFDSKWLLVLSDNECIKEIYVQQIPSSIQDKKLGQNLTLSQSGILPRI
jgi:hypothetical protein